MWTVGHGKNIFFKLIESIKNKNKKKTNFLVYLDISVGATEMVGLLC